MNRFLSVTHLIGLAMVVGLVLIMALYWPLPFSTLRSIAPDFHKMVVLPYFRDYQDLIAFLIPILLLSIAHTLWNWAKTKIDKRSENG